jgi:hypothetical protein
LSVSSARDAALENEVGTIATLCAARTPALSMRSCDFVVTPSARANPSYEASAPDVSSAAEAHPARLVPAAKAVQIARTMSRSVRVTTSIPNSCWLQPASALGAAEQSQYTNRLVGLQDVLRVSGMAGAAEAGSGAEVCR